jgi:hypothetical protein
MLTGDVFIFFCTCFENLSVSSSKANFQHISLGKGDFNSCTFRDAEGTSLAAVGLLPIPFLNLTNVAQRQFEACFYLQWL